MTLPALPVETAAALGARHGAPEHLRTSNISVRVLHSPAVGAALLRFLDAFITQTCLEKRTRELIILRLAWSAGSEYVFGRHAPTARNCGMSEAEILGVRDPDRCAAYDPLDRAVLRATDELMRDARIGEATQAALAQRYSPQEVVEIVIAVGTWRIFAALDNTAGIPLDEGFAGWPEGKSPARHRADSAG